VTAGFTGGGGEAKLYLHLVQIFTKSGREVEQLGQVFMNAIRYEMTGMNIPKELRIISRNNRGPN
jgi:hypothetical protein